MFQYVHAVTPRADSPIVTIVNSAVCWAGAAVAVAGWACWGVTFTTWARLMPSAFFVPFFVLAFPVFGWAVFQQTRGRRSQPAPDLLKSVPRWARAPIVVAVVAVLLTWGTGAAVLSGQPEYDPKLHRYFYDDHGTRIPATLDGFLHAVAVQNRLFLAMAMLFVSVGTALAFQERSRRRRELPRLDRPHPVRP